jgi:hypothetical protein
VAATLFVLALAALLWSGTVGDLRVWRQHSGLDQRGLTMTATLLGYFYNPEGGDPDGWTTDKVRFVTEAARVVVAIIGHHAPGPSEQPGL